MMSLSNLPPGVTQKMIDDYFGGKPLCEPCEDGQHGDCERGDCECDECREAEVQHRSLAQQAVAVLARGLQLELDPKSRRKMLLARINAEPIRLNRDQPVDPAVLIREDRER